ncbi:MAG: peptidoglycan DD-metalloendopeptidase family protein [Bacteroidales bacterium]|jgi:murein DD-endopeptidase MepM/ murein hydrolase activator NlpD|nr:peptidoglycan DD-metalloendopeptidase family protein [Bacteroidales bacterium]
MNRVGRVILFFTFLLIFENAHSQPFIDLRLQPRVLPGDEISLEEDELSLDSLAFLANIGTIDSTMVPASKLYNYIWCNRYVNPYNQRVIDMTDTVLIDFSQYCHPNKNVVTSDFGFRRGWRFHYGIDTRLKTGDPICSSFDGMIRIVNRGRAYGNYVVIRHFNGLETVYGHLSKTMVKVNQVVRAGEVIGLGGNTGRSTGPHLHYEIRYLGQPISPRDLIDFESYTAIYRKFNLSSGYFAYVKDVEKVRFYTVRNGDTLYGISRKIGVSMDKLCQLNNIRKSSVIKPGQKLRYT